MCNGVDVNVKACQTNPSDRKCYITKGPCENTIFSAAKHGVLDWKFTLTTEKLWRSMFHIDYRLVGVTINVSLMYAVESRYPQFAT